MDYLEDTEYNSFHFGCQVNMSTPVCQIISDVHCLTLESGGDNLNTLMRRNKPHLISLPVYSKAHHDFKTTAVCCDEKAHIFLLGTQSIDAFIFLFKGDSLL